MATHINGIDIDSLRGTIGELEKDPDLGRCQFRLKNRWIEGTRNIGRVSTYYAVKQEMEHPQTFEVAADEPPIISGNDTAITPVENLLAALASCVTSSIVLHASVRGIDIEQLESEVEGDMDLNGFVGLSEVPKGFQEIRIKLRVKSDADPELIEQLASFSPTLNTISQGAKVRMEVEKRS